MFERVLLAQVGLRFLPTQKLSRGGIDDAVSPNAGLLTDPLLAVPNGFHLRAMVATVHVGHGSNAYGSSQQGANQQVKSALSQHV